MNVCRWIGAGRCSSVISIAVATLIAVGCTANNKQPQPAPNVPVPPGGPIVPAGPPIVPGGSRPDAMDTSADPAVSTPLILERRTAAYTKTMEAAIQKRQPAKTAEKHTLPDAQLAAAQIPPTPAKQPSEVQFLDPSANRLSLFPAGLEPAPPKMSTIAPAPVEESALSNTPASVEGGPLRTPRLPGDEPAENATGEQKIQLAMIQPPTLSTPRNPVPAASSDTLDQRLGQRVRDYPHDVSAHLDYELSRFITDQPVPDLATMSVLPSEDAEMLAAVLDGLSNFRNNLRADANMLMSKKVAPLLDSAERLRSHAGLTIGTVCLCTEVKTFGVYTPFPGDPPNFTAGVKHPILVYVEVTNFSSELTGDKQWQTDLPFSLMLYSEQGMPEWKENRQSKPDTSHTRRHDFFFVQPATLQPNLPPGRHLLKITVEDTQAHRFAESTIPLSIEADPATP